MVWLTGYSVYRYDRDNISKIYLFYQLTIVASQADGVQSWVSWYMVCVCCVMCCWIEDSFTSGLVLFLHDHSSSCRICSDLDPVFVLFLSPASSCVHMRDSACGIFRARVRWHFCWTHILSSYVHLFCLLSSLLNYHAQSPARKGTIPISNALFVFGPFQHYFHI